MPEVCDVTPDSSAPCTDSAARGRWASPPGARTPRRILRAGVAPLVVLACALACSMAAGTWHGPEGRSALDWGTHAAARTASTSAASSAAGVPRGTAPTPAASSPRVAAPAAVAAARAIAGDLARRGRLGVEVHIEVTDLGQPNALASFDAGRDRCIVRLDPRLDAETSSTAFRFLVYHELSHCELFARPGLFSGGAGLDADAARMLDDLLVLDLIDPPEDRSLYHWHDVAHETYADLRALAMLREDGVDTAALAGLAARRDQTPFDFGHQTADALRGLLARPGASATGQADPELERDVRQRAALALVDRELRLILPAGGPAAPALEAMLRSKMRGALQRRARDERSWALELAYENGLAHPARPHAVPMLAWYARADGRGRDPASIERDLEAWLDEAYGPAPRRRTALRQAAGRLQRLVAQADAQRRSANRVASDRTAADRLAAHPSPGLLAITAR